MLGWAGGVINWGVSALRGATIGSRRLMCVIVLKKTADRPIREGMTLGKSENGFRH
jgi:hypothetical protein